jgi:cytidylate kinase
VKREYDFSRGERGKFDRRNAKLLLPIYLDIELQSQLERIAEKKGKDVSEIATQLLRRDVKLIDDFGA